MIKIIQDFLPRPLFDYMKLVVENEQGMLWNFNPRNLQPQSKASGSENYKLGKTLYVHPSLSGTGKEVYDKELMPLFGLFQQFMMVHMQPKCRGSVEEKTECKLVRMKMNLYPNQGTNVKHGIHNDIMQNGMPRPDVITSVFNFHTCNGSTILYEKDKDGKFSDNSKEVVVPSTENSMIMFNNTHPHYGIVQSDTPTRIVLNTNLEKAYVDPFGPPDENGKSEFEPVDDYF
tara:strand:- start:31 stop:723 length:693 start_codon:yes stop_codon:yes gene_type:complete